jgi:hypothetical protein
VWLPLCLDRAFTDKQNVHALSENGKLRDAETGPCQIRDPRRKKNGRVGRAGHDTKDCGREVEKKSVFLDHNLGGFNDSDDVVALLELQLVGAAPGYGAFNQILAHPDDYMGHYVAQLDFLDGSAQFVSR